MATYNLYANASATGVWADPDTNFSTGTTLSMDGGRRAYLKFDLTPALLKRVTQLRAIFYVINRDIYLGESNTKLSGCLEDWNESEVTWNNFAGGGYFDLVAGSVPSSGTWITIVPESELYAIKHIEATGLRIAIWDSRLFTNIYSSRSPSNKPYLYVTAEPVALSAANMLPNAFVDREFPIVFSWNPTNPYASTTIGTVVQASAKLRYRMAGVSGYTEILIADGTSSYAFPANTFAYADHEWQIELTSNDGVVSTSAWQPFTTMDKIPGKPLLKSPTNSYVDGAVDTTFSWEHVIDTGSPQSRADLQYAVGSNTWQTLATVMGAQESVIIAANAMPPGRLSWRARTYNTDDVAGDWSDAAAFVCERAPDAPTITGISQCNRPTITWQVIGQVAYQLMFDDIDTGEVAGTVKTYKLKDYKANGAHTVKLRVLGSTGLWSQWTEVALTLNAPAPATPTLALEAMSGRIKLTFTNGDRQYLLRDGVPIANVSGLTEYTDYMALGDVIYTLRAVDALDNYADSEEAGATVSVPCAVIAAVDTPSELVLLRLTRENPRVITGSAEKTVTYRYYAGRKRPVAIFAGQNAEKYTLSVAYLNATEKGDFIRLVDREKTMLYRDAWGNRWFMTIPSFGSSQDSIASSIEVNMTVTDYTERIDYEV